MKSTIQWFGLAVIITALVAGCDNKTAKDGAGTLTASDLAQLMDVHAWKCSIPQAQQPVKAIRLVLVNRRDGSVVSKFSTGASLGTNCTCVRLAIRMDHGEFKGRLLTSAPDGSGLGWEVNFTDAFADSIPAWCGSGTLIWNGNQAELASSTKNNMFDTILAVELEK